MNRGDRREPILHDDFDRKRFVATLSEACAKTDWQVHAYCLMNNHFHLVVETPEANLVAGMRWFLSTYTARFNRRHKLFGHLFSGRYKSLIVDGSGSGYLRTVCDYVHLNPVRAKLLSSEKKLREYAWSSWPDYLKPPQERPRWLRVEDLPLAGGTNLLTLSVTNAAGLSNVTNICLVKSAMTLCVTNIDGDLWQPTVNVGGFISDASYAVWVNGVQGVNYGDGTWLATNVPVSPGGVASFDLSAVNGGDPGANTNIDKQPRLYMESYTESDGSTSGGVYSTVPPDAPCYWTYNFAGASSCYWTDNVGGVGSYAFNFHFANNDCNGGYDNPWLTMSKTSPASPWESITAGIYFQTNGDNYNDFGYSGNSSGAYTNSWMPPIVWEHCDELLWVGVGAAGWPYQWQGSWYESDSNNTGLYHRNADAVLKLKTGGKGLSKLKNLFQLASTATEVLDPHAYADGFQSLQMIPGSTQSIPPQNITIDGHPVGSDGNQWRAYEDNDTRDVTPRVKNKDFYTFTLDKQKYKLQIFANGYLLAHDKVNLAAQFCVGQYIGFEQQFLPFLPETTIYSPVKWAFDGTYVNTNIPPDYDDPDYLVKSGLTMSGSGYYTNEPAFLTGLSAHAWWISGGANGDANSPATYNATLGEGLTFANGQYVALATHGQFHMYRPQVVNPTVTAPEISFILASDNSPNELIANFGYSAKVICPVTFSGQAFYTQLIDRAETNNYSNPLFGWETEYSGEFVLDGDSPYGSDSSLTLPSTLRVQHGDDPFVKDGFPVGSFVDYVYCKDLFKLYLQFQPSGSDSIPVTLGRIDWGWEGLEKKTSGVWTMSVNNPSGPTPDWSDESFPYWRYIRPK